MRQSRFTTIFFCPLRSLFRLSRSRDMCVCVISHMCVSYLSLPPHTCFTLLALLYYVTFAHVCGGRLKKNSKKEISSACSATRRMKTSRPGRLHTNTRCTTPSTSTGTCFFFPALRCSYLTRICCGLHVCAGVCVCARGTNHPISSLDRLEGGMHEGFVKIEDKSHLVLHLN